MQRWLVTGAYVLFGVVPATYLFLWIAFFTLVAAVSLPIALISPPDYSGSTIVPWKVLAFFSAGTAAVAGYIALLSAVRGVMTRRVVVGLLFGIAANVYAIPMYRDINPYAMKQWLDWYWFGSPIVVASVRVVTYFVRARRERAQKRR